MRVVAELEQLRDEASGAREAPSGTLRIDMPDIERLSMPVELRLELRAIVGLEDVDAEREPLPHLVKELDGGPLVASVEDFEHSDSGAIVDGGELIEALLRQGNALEEITSICKR